MMKEGLKKAAAGSSFKPNKIVPLNLSDFDENAVFDAEKPQEAEQAKPALEEPPQEEEKSTIVDHTPIDFDELDLIDLAND